MARFDIAVLDPYLAFLVAISQDLETVCGNGKELHVVTL